MTESIKEIVRIRDNQNFLGYEFLTWLFLLIDRDRNQNEVNEITKDLVFKSTTMTLLGERLVTCLLNHKEQKTSVSSPILEESHEVFASIRNGHLIEALSLKLRLGDIGVGLTIHAQDFAFTNIVIKNNFENESLSDDEHDLSEAEQTREDIFLRVKALEETELVINTFYQHFCAERLDNQMLERRLKQMREHVTERLDHYLQKSATGSYEPRPRTEAIVS